MAGLQSFMWRTRLSWPETVATAELVITRWNTVTPFTTKTDQRERIWTARHSTTPQPFMVIAQDNLSGSAPRIGNPLPMLLLLGMALQKPDAFDLIFANGQKIDPQRFELADLTGLLPHATHAAHRKLAELSLQPTPPAAPPTAA